MAKAPDSYLHGEDGAIVVVSGHVAAFLKRRGALDKLRLDARDMKDLEVYYVLNSLHRAALLHESSPTPRTMAMPSAQAPVVLTTGEAASLLQLTPRGVRDACERGRLEAHQEQGRWRITRAAVERYRQAS
jgi:excisionase family DNA binding protein